MKLIAIETSSQACSVALKVHDDVLSDHRLVNREHAALLLPMISQLLSQASVSASELDGVVYGQGPGSFTGVRIAAAAAQGLAVAADCGVQGVSSLHLAAQTCAHIRKSQGLPTELIQVAMDARMQEIYTGFYAVDSRHQNVICSPLGDEVVVRPEQIDYPQAFSTYSAGSTPTVTLCGTGIQDYESTLVEGLSQSTGLPVEQQPDILPVAKDLFSLVDSSSYKQWGAAESAQPVYLRNKVALTEAERLSP